MLPFQNFMKTLDPAIKRIIDIWQDVIAAIPGVIIALIVFLLFQLAAKMVRRVAYRIVADRESHVSLALLLGRLIQGGVVFMGAMIALVIALPSFKPAQMIQLLGISSVAIGFAFKDILQNFLAGLLLLMTEPFQLNDQVKIGDFEGTVEDIQTRATVLCTYDGRRVVIPNGEVFNKAIIVNTAYEKRRLEYDISIGYDEDIDAARQVLMETLRSAPNVLNEPEPEVLAMELGDSSIVLRARWWINPPRQVDVMQTRDQVVTMAKRALDKAGIEIPYPKHVVIMAPYETNGTPFDNSRSNSEKSGQIGGYEARLRKSRETPLP